MKNRIFCSCWYSITATSSCLKVTFFTNCELGIFRKQLITNIRIILPKGAKKDIHSSEKAKELASVEKSGTIKGSFVLLKNTAQMNHKTVMLQFNKVHLICLGERILVTLIRLKIRLPLITRFLNLNSRYSLSFFISLKVSFMLLNSSSSVEYN